MKITNINSNYIHKLKIFNSTVFPKRKKVSEIIDFWFGKSKNEISNSVFLLGDNDEIWGQSLFSSMNYFYQGEEYQGKWEFDYIIREDKRKDFYGIDLMQYILKNKNCPIWATGSGPMALKIELKMGYKMIGELKKYVGIVNPFFFISSFFRNISLNSFPLQIQVKNSTYKLLDKEILQNKIDAYNNDLIEFGRDKEFLCWRYFNAPHYYAIYYNYENNDYFVLRTIIKHHVNCMVLVDYRCDINSGFEQIAMAAKKVTSELKLSVLIVGSSLNKIDSLLEKQHFKAIGRHRPIITTTRFNTNEEKERIKQRNFVLVTLADSDGEITW